MTAAPRPAGAGVAVAGDDFARHLASLEHSWTGLPCKPDETPEATLRALWLTAAGRPCSAELAARRSLPALGLAERRELDRLVDQRRSGVPLSYLTGRQSFMGLELRAGPEALIPRRETELLGNAALDLLRGVIAERGRALVVDLCTGAGNLALALAHHETACEVAASDLSADAVSLARRNAEELELTDRVRFFEGDLFAPFGTEDFRRKVDLVVCNPPYISSVKVDAMPEEISRFEPRLALDGGAFGISILFKLVTGAPRLLKPGSWLCFEVGAGQGEPMAARLERAAAYDVVDRVCDRAGNVRALLARTRD
jgi:release factor glutamine methyltransferase